MTEGDVSDARAKQAGGQGFSVTDDQTAFGIFRHRTTRHVGVADGDQGLTRLAFQISRFNQQFMYPANTAQVVVAQGRANQLLIP